MACTNTHELDARMNFMIYGNTYENIDTILEASITEAMTHEPCVYAYGGNQTWDDRTRTCEYLHAD